MYISILCVRLWKIYRNVTKRGEEYSYRWLLRGTIFYLRYGFNIIKNILKYYETGRRIFLRIVAPRDTPRHPTRLRWSGTKLALNQIQIKNSNTFASCHATHFLVINATHSSEVSLKYKVLLNINHILCAVENGVLTVDLPGATLKIMLP